MFPTQPPFFAWNGTRSTAERQSRPVLGPRGCATLVLLVPKLFPMALIAHLHSPMVEPVRLGGHVGKSIPPLELDKIGKSSTE